MANAFVVQLLAMLLVSVNFSPLVVINPSILWGAFHDHFVPCCWEGLSPVLKKVFVDRPLNVLFITGLGQKSKFSGHLYSSYGAGKYSLLLHLPISRVTLLQSLIIYRAIHLINCFKSNHHYFLLRLSYTLCNTRSKNLVETGKIQIV